MAASLSKVQAKLACNLKAIRLSKGVTQEEMALEAGIDRTYASQIERAIANPSLSVLVKLAQFLECDVVDLLKD